MLLSLSILIFFKLIQPSSIFSAALTILFPITIDSSLVQLANASFPMVCILLGIVKDVIPLYDKAKAPICAILLGSTIDVNEPHL